MVGLIDVFPDVQQVIVCNFDGGGIEALDFDGAVVCDGGVFFDVGEVLVSQIVEGKIDFVFEVAV